MSINRNARFTKRFNHALGMFILILTTILLFAPIAALLTTSIKLDSEYNRWPIVFIPKVSQWINYVRVFTMTPFLQVALRTGLLAIGYSLIITTSSAMAGYAFARYRIPANGKLFGIVIAMLIVPGIVLLIPQFILYARLKLTNTYWPWILGAIAGGPFYIFLFRQFFLNFPNELEEAAEMDGCGPLRVFLQIFIPNSQAVIATVMFFAFTSVWSDYLGPLLYLNDSKTLLGVKMASAFKNPQGVTLTTVSMAATVIYILPPVIAFFLAQKHILKGAVTSGIKG